MYHQHKVLGAMASIMGLLLASGCSQNEQTTTTGSGGTGGGTGGQGAGGGGGTGAQTGSGAAGGGTTSSGGGTGGAAGASCIDEGHTAGERFSVGDNCNFCDCHADGTKECTNRTCTATMSGCTYDGKDYAYAEHFPATDACNECVCAASGLACTRRPDCAPSDEGAILMESLDTPCGPDLAFTGKSVLDGLPVSDLVVPFLYQKDGPLYPESLPDTTVRVRVVYDGGFVVCRIPAPGQEAFDIEALAEWITADGSFDEGFHTYLRRSAPKFVDVWTVAANAPKGGLHGTFNPACLDPNGFGFSATMDANGTAGGDVSKTCETDIGLTVGSWSYPDAP